MKGNDSLLSKYYPSKNKWESQAKNSTTFNRTGAIDLLRKLPALTGTGPSVRILFELKTSQLLAVQGNMETVLGVPFEPKLVMDTLVPFISLEHIDFIEKNFLKYFAYITSLGPEDRENVEFSIAFKYVRKSKKYWLNQRVFKHISDEDGALTHVLMEYTDITEVKNDNIAQYVVYNKSTREYILNEEFIGEGCYSKELTHTEIEIAQMIKEGLSVPEIASSRFVSSHTVKQHKKNIYKKLNISKASQLVKWVYERGAI